MIKDKLLLATISLGHASTHWYLAAFYLILPYLSQDFQLSYSQVGAIVAARSLVAATANIPSGAIADIFGRKRLMLAIAVIWPAVFYILLGFSPEYGLVLFFAALVGFGNSLWHPPAMSILSERFPERRGFALSMHETGANLGDFLAPIAVGFLMTFLTWRFTLFANVPPAIILLVLVWISVSDERLGKKARLSLRQYGGALRTMFTNRVLLGLSVISATRTMGQNALHTFLPIYLAYEVGLSPATIGLYVGMLTFASLFTGPVMGTVSDRTGRKPILLSGLLLSSILMASLGVSRSGIPFLSALVLLGFFLFSMRPVIFAHALDVTPRDVGSTTTSFLFAMNTAFSAISPVIAGMIADRAGLVYAFYFSGGLVLIAFLTTIFIPSRTTTPTPQEAPTAP